MHIQPVYPAAIANGHVKEGIFLTISKVHSEQDARFPIHIFLIYVIFYVGHAFYNTYNTLFLYENGLTQEQIGFINSIFTAILIFIKPMWGVISDRSKNKARIIGVLLIANALVCVAFYISASAYWLALCVILYQFFFQPAYTLQESYTLELMDKSRWDYGNIRLGGTLGYAVCAMFTGVLIGDDYGKIYWMMALLYGAAGVLQLFTKPIPGQRKKKEKIPYRQVFSHAPLICIICFQLLSSLGSSFSMYYSIYFRHELGAPSELLGWMTTIGAISELPFFWYAGRIERKIGTHWFLAIATSSIILKMVCLSFVTNPYLVLALQVLSGMSVVSSSYCIIKYINDTVPAQMRTTAQMTNAIITTIFSTVICAPIVGWLDGLLGTQAVLLIGAGVSAVAVILFLLIFPAATRYQKKKEAALNTPS